MNMSRIRWGLVALAVAALAGCGGGGDDAVAPVVPPTGTPVNAAILAASALPANDSATNSSAPFAVVQSAGVPAVTINSPPKVNFTVISDGAVKSNLTFADVRVAIAKLVPGTDGNPDQWVNYVYATRAAAVASATRKDSAAVAATLGASAAFPAGTKVAATDTRMSATDNRLAFNPDGYYTYTFATDITDPTKTNGVIYEPGLTHRIALQLTYKNAAGETIRVDPYYDFTIDAAGKSVPVNASQSRKMTDVASCNSCHEKLALHGGGRVDTQYCVMCHNNLTIDPNSGNNLNLSTMTHKIHSAKLLKSKVGGENVTIGTADFTEVGFPQDLRNCTKCHSAANPATPQGDNWKTKPTKEACLTCHANNAGSAWDTSHLVYAKSAEVNGGTAKPNAVAKDLTNAQCATCHAVGTPVSPENVHWNQNEENSAKYKMNIEDVTYNATTRVTTVKYFLSDPTNANAAYDLVTSECTVSAATPPVTTCANTTKFGNLRFYLGYQNMVGQATSPTTEFTAGSGISQYAYKGTNLGNNHYTLDLPAIPENTATLVFSGTGRVVSLGQIKENKLQVKTNVLPRPDVVGQVPADRVSVVVQNTFKDVALTGTLKERRTVVSNDKCNACHGALGTTSGANTLANAFHGGARDIVESCSICHDVNRASSSNVMTNGLPLYESYQFKRMIHGIHGNSKRTSPFTHGNRVRGAFGMDGVLTAAGGTFLADYTASIKVNNAATGTTMTAIAVGAPVAGGATFDTIATMMTDSVKALKVAQGDTSSTNAVGAAENYAAEVAWPGVGLNCNACHVNNSYKKDLSPLGTVVFKDTGVTDPNQWKVISPKASSCTACHDSSNAIGHVTSFGASAFGDKVQAGLPQETCDDCHAPGGFKGVDIVHGQK
ncbi:MAG: OmcA/MtrC family decaheme c-type cytochrome [Burkholderiales bacterium]|nr:OmcA/MtrC family decaheme c-type cytochrome [Burkholderiales bacterium]